MRSEESVHTRRNVWQCQQGVLPAFVGFEFGDDVGGQWEWIDSSPQWRLMCTPYMLQRDRKRVCGNIRVFPSPKHKSLPLDEPIRTQPCEHQSGAASTHAFSGLGQPGEPA